MSSPLFIDHAASVLQNAPVDDAARADLWDIFHGSKDHNELARRLQPLAVPDQVKSDLYDAKEQSQPTGPTERIVAALTAMSQLDPKLLDLAEKNHTLAKLMIEAATKG